MTSFKYPARVIVWWSSAALITICAAHIFGKVLSSKNAQLTTASILLYGLMLFSFAAFWVKTTIQNTKYKNTESEIPRPVSQESNYWRKFAWTSLLISVSSLTVLHNFFDSHFWWNYRREAGSGVIYATLCSIYILNIVVVVLFASLIRNKSLNFRILPISKGGGPRGHGVVAASVLTAAFLIVTLAVSFTAVPLFPRRGETDLNKLSGLYSNVIEWEQRAGVIREGILDKAGLNPLPGRTELNAIIHSFKDLGDYTVENLFFESLPGFFVTGNLYRPKNLTVSDLVPVVLIPHGHFEQGRFEEHNQQLGATFARMGMIAMTYDMVGKDESTQMGHNDKYVFGLQLWNSMRVIDFLLTVPGADSNRVGVTGASGGGTQAFMLAAVDGRVSASVPVVMVSSEYYGGCNCENGMPVHKGTGYETNNAEIAAMTAPRPQMLISCGKDWTRDTPKREYPYLQYVYGFYGSTDNISNAHFPDEYHDYGPNKRRAAYSFFASVFGLSTEHLTGANGIIDEGPNTLLAKEELLAFTRTHPRPSYALQVEKAVLGVLRSLH